MKTVTENDLLQINQKLDQVVNSLSQVNHKLNDLEKNQIRIETELKGLSNQLTDYKDQTSQRFDDVINRINDTNGRLNTMTLGFFGIVGVLVTGLLAIIGKVLFFPQV